MRRICGIFAAQTLLYLFSSWLLTMGRMMKAMMYRAMLLVALLMTAVLAVALPVNGLYDANVSVPDQGKDSYNQGVIKGIQQVLVKVSGDRDVVLDAALSQRLSAAAQWVTEFSYSEALNEPNNAVTNPWVLNLHFDEKAINQLLNETQHPLWERDRPQLLLWLAQQTSDGKQLIGNGSDATLMQLIGQVANQRGLTLMLPMLDLSDLNQVTVDEVWAPLPSLPQLTSAAKRYNTSSMLIGRLYVSDAGSQGWQADWLLVTNGEQESWHNSAVTQNEVITTAINHFVDNIAQQHRVVATADKAQDVHVQVFGVASVTDLTRVRTYLQGLSVVSGLAVASLGDNYVTFDVQINGDAGKLANTLAGDHVLMPDTDVAPIVGQLTYKLAA